MIDREKVIKGLEHHTNLGIGCTGCPYNGDCHQLPKDVLELLKEQERSTAYWEKITGMAPPEYHGHYMCSKCEWHGMSYNEREMNYRYCPCCGAKMKVR